VVDVRPSGRASSSIALRRANTGTTASSSPILEAGTGAAPETPAPATETVGAGGTPDAAVNDDHGEIAWRLRHARRAVLKDATLPEDILAGDAPVDTNRFDAPSFFGRSGGSAARVAANFFAGTPFSGQVNLLTTGSSDTPQQLFTTDNFSHNTAYLALGAPVGEHADWTARAALTQGDIASWIVAGEYTSRVPPARENACPAWTPPAGCRHSGPSPRS